MVEQEYDEGDVREREKWIEVAEKMAKEWRQYDYDFDYIFAASFL